MQQWWCPKSTLFLIQTMGIAQQDKILWKSVKLSINDAIYFLEKHLQRHKQGGHTTRIRPRVAIDVSLLGYPFLGKNFFYSCWTIRIDLERGVNVTEFAFLKSK